MKSLNLLFYDGNNQALHRIEAEYKIKIYFLRAAQ